MTYSSATVLHASVYKSCSLCSCQLWEMIFSNFYISEIDSEEGLAATLEAIAQLPPANKDTLAYLILHLQKLV